MSIEDDCPVTPGEMLKEEFLVEYGLSQNQLAKAIGIRPTGIAEIVKNRRRIMADTALASSSTSSRLDGMSGFAHLSERSEAKREG